MLQRYGILILLSITAVLASMLWHSNSYAYKHSLLVPDLATSPAYQDDRLKLTYILREELAGFDALSLINRNRVLSIFKIGSTPNSAADAPKKEVSVDIAADVLYNSEIDFAIVGELEEANTHHYRFRLYLVNYEGPLSLFEKTFDSNETAVEDGIKKTVHEMMDGVGFFAHADDQNATDTDEMIMIPGGSAIIGSFTGEPFEAPQREVYINTFSIDKYEVTNEQYKKFVEQQKMPSPANMVNTDYTIWKNGTYPEELAKHPVVNVTWFEADAYCRWVGKRLPTMIEWEKSARGPYGNIYPWGNEYFEGIANLYTKGISYEKQQTSPVGGYPRSKSYYGLHDMAGNVWEWTADSQSKHVKKAPQGDRKIAKGGGWGYNGNKNSARSSYMIFFTPDYTSNCLGFRCAK